MAATDAGRAPELPLPLVSRSQGVLMAQTWLKLHSASMSRVRAVVCTLLAWPRLSQACHPSAVPSAFISSHR